MTDHLVTTSWLANHLADPTVVVLEVSIDPPDAAAYGGGHIPGSQFVYWKDLLWHDTDRQFPSPEVMARRLGKLGIGEDTTIALVGDPFQFAAYAYWVLTMTGHEARCRLVDGGRRAWLSEQLPLSTEVFEPEARRLGVGPEDASSRVGRDAVRRGLGTADGPLLIDMRSPEEYLGERVSPPWLAYDHGAERGGHIPGAHHLFFEDLLDDNGTLLPIAHLRERFSAAGADGNRPVITYCRLSHRAALGWFVLTRILGTTDVQVYDGSWTEWGSIVGFPIER